MPVRRNRSPAGAAADATNPGDTNMASGRGSTGGGNRGSNDGSDGGDPWVRHAFTDRREVLRLAGRAAALALAGPTVAGLAGCASGSGGAAAPGGSTGAPGGTTGTSTRPAGPTGTLVAESYDPSRPYWMQGNYAPVADEVELTALEVTGSLPPELTGVFVRNGSNPASGDSAHWFLGDGMVHGLRLERGKAAWYRNRYVQTPMVHTTTGIAGGGGPPGGANNQSNVSAFLHAGKLLTSGEVGFPFQLDPRDLSTVGAYDFGGKLTTAMTAHPKIDPATGKLHFFGYGFVPPFLTYHVAAADGTLERSEEIAVGGPSMVHDFAITDREAVFWEGPILFDIEIAIKMVQGEAGAFPFSWKPEYGSRIGILPFDQPGSAIRWVEIPNCYVFHGINAHRDGDDVVIDVCRLPEAFSDKGDLTVISAIHRWRVGTGGTDLTFSDEKVSDAQMDLPGIDRRHTGLPHRHAWFATIDRDDSPFPFDMSGITHLDQQTGAMDVWDPKGADRAGEGLFVPGGSGEGEGWIVSYAFDRRRGASDFVVLDALDLAKGPIARVHLPRRVPYGFHGTWVPDDAVAERAS